VWVEGEEISLTQLEFNLLIALIKRRSHVHSRSGLLAKVWDIRSDVTSRTVDTHVKRLREKLGAARDYIETVRGVGYRFVNAPPETSGQMATPPNGSAFVAEG
jgi:two-component system phosphate regulon response regulator PhoB